MVHNKADYIMSVPVVSLYHLTSEDYERLSNDDENWPMVAKYREGFIVWMLREDLDEWDLSLSEGMQRLFMIHFANVEPGETVAMRFDEEGCEIGGVPVRQD